MGVIRNIVVGGTRLDSRCPDAEVNTAVGMFKKLPFSPQEPLALWSLYTRITAQVLRND
jgi:hypothetical protein